MWQWAAQKDAYIEQQSSQVTDNNIVSTEVFGPVISFIAGRYG
jgi:hypothetical protein